jgi:hypothetical protein
MADAHRRYAGFFLRERDDAAEGNGNAVWKSLRQGKLWVITDSMEFDAATRYYVSTILPQVESRLLTR